jgi:hypothetical protein
MGETFRQAVATFAKRRAVAECKAVAEADCGAAPRDPTYATAASTSRATTSVAAIPAQASLADRVFGKRFDDLEWSGAAAR